MGKKLEMLIPVLTLVLLAAVILGGLYSRYGFPKLTAPAEDDAGYVSEFYEDPYNWDTICDVLNKQPENISDDQAEALAFLCLEMDEPGFRRFLRESMEIQGKVWKTKPSIEKVLTFARVLVYDKCLTNEDGSNTLPVAVCKEEYCNFYTEEIDPEKIKSAEQNDWLENKLNSMLNLGTLEYLSQIEIKDSKKSLDNNNFKISFDYDQKKCILTYKTKSFFGRHQTIGISVGEAGGAWSDVLDILRAYIADNARVKKTPPRESVNLRILGEQGQFANLFKLAMITVDAGGDSYGILYPGSSTQNVLNYVNDTIILKDSYWWNKEDSRDSLKTMLQKEFNGELTMDDLINRSGPVLEFFDMFSEEFQYDTVNHGTIYVRPETGLQNPIPSG